MRGGGLQSSIKGLVLGREREKDSVSSAISFHSDTL